MNRRFRVDPILPDSERIRRARTGAWLLLAVVALLAGLIAWELLF